MPRIVEKDAHCSTLLYFALLCFTLLYFAHCSTSQTLRPKATPESSCAVAPWAKLLPAAGDADGCAGIAQNIPVKRDIEICWNMLKCEKYKLKLCLARTGSGSKRAQRSAAHTTWDIRLTRPCIVKLKLCLKNDTSINDTHVWHSFGKKNMLCQGRLHFLPAAGTWPFAVAAAHHASSSHVTPVTLPNLTDMGWSWYSRCSQV